MVYIKHKKNIINASIGFAIKDSGIDTSVDTNLHNGKIAINFKQNNLPEYGYTDSIGYVELNGKKLSKTQYVRNSLGAALLINERLLLDGENKLIIKSTLYDDISLKFDYDNETLRNEKASLSEKVATPSNARKVSKSDVEGFQNKIEAAKTLRELRSVGIDFDVAIFGSTKAKL